MSDTDSSTAPASEATADDASSANPEANTAEEIREEENPLLKALHAERKTVKELKQQLDQFSKAAEEQRLSALSEQERAIEEARKSGFDEAMSSVKADLVKSKVTAAAASAGFADPGDAASFMDVAAIETDDDIAQAVADLAKAKPYLLKRTSVPLEQGQQGQPMSSTPSDWLRGVLQ